MPRRLSLSSFQPASPALINRHVGFVSLAGDRRSRASMADLLVAGDWAATMASSTHCGSNVHRRHGPFLSHLGIPPSAKMTGSLSHWLRAEVAVGPQNPQPSLDCPHPLQDPLGPVPTLEQPPDPSHIQRDLTDTRMPLAHTTLAWPAPRVRLGRETGTGQGHARQHKHKSRKGMPGRKPKAPK